jgi:hypothetical protein
LSNPGVRVPAALGHARAPHHEVAAGAPRALPRGMTTPTAELERCAAYTAARDALVHVHDASTRWPEDVASGACRAAVAAVAMTAEGLDHPTGTSARGRCIREALGAALVLAGALEVAKAIGEDDGDDDVGSGIALARHHAGRSVALLGLLLHANTIVAER